MQKTLLVGFVLKIFFFGLLLSLLADHPAFAQTTQGKSSKQSITGDSGGANRGQSGGGSQADFSTLMQIIRETVPGNWDVDDTMLPYPNGVWIDPAGKLHREKASSVKTGETSDKKITSRPSTSSKPSEYDPSAFTKVPMLDELGLEQEESLRWISLREIERLIQEHDQTPTSIKLELLGGLTRIDHVARDPDSNDWYLGGPAGGLVLDPSGNLIGRTTRLPPILFEDLLCVAPLVLHARGPLGCSIDPIPESLKKLSEQVQLESFGKRLRSQPEKTSMYLADALGDQKAVFFGLADDSPTAMALLVADEHMKRLGLGLVTPPRDLTNYWMECERTGAAPPQSMVRWWFALPERIRIGVDVTGDVFSINSSTVQVLSQQQFIDQKGERRDAQGKDLAADAFASSFTKNFATLQTIYPDYARLRHIFDLAVSLQLIRDETKNKDELAFHILGDSRNTPSVKSPIRWVPSIAAWRKMSSGHVAAVVSGGVKVDTNKLKLDRATSERSIERSPPQSLR